mmetsp:Transcript_27955/g.58585  ORF Transcript_27955/g.58585 Transcript_27955/m.58585 type:complete len:577 (+) Transcript_27955:127-1857(+)
MTRKVNYCIIDNEKESPGLCYEHEEYKANDNNDNYQLNPSSQRWEGEKQQQQQQQQHQSILRSKVILSILVTETAERIAYFGFRAVLVLYFAEGLKFTESTSVSLFASVTGFAYLSPLIGALLADNQWGRYKTIWRFGVVYSIGLCLIALGAYQLDSPSSSVISCPSSTINATSSTSDNCDDTATNEPDVLVARSLSFIGLILVCLGTGGIKPCVSAFGADQVVLADNDSVARVSRTALTTSSSSSTTTTTTIYSHADNDYDDYTSPKTMSATNTELPISNDNRPLENKEDNVREFFNSFYFCINVGALLSFAIIPIIRANYGFSTAFFIPVVFMIGALGIFLSQRKAYKHRRRDPSQPSLFRTLYVCSTILIAKIFRKNRQCNSPTLDNSGIHTAVSTILSTPSCVEDEDLEVSEGSKKDQATEEGNNAGHQVRQDAEQVLHLMPLMLFFPVFCMLYDQQGSVWMLQVTRLNCHGLQPEQSGLLNPLEIMFFIPLFDQVIYPWLEAKGFNIQPLRRMEYGMFLTAIAFFASTLLEYSIQKGPPKSISLAWQIPQITILTVAEILLNVTGLEVRLF